MKSELNRLANVNETLLVDGFMEESGVTIGKESITWGIVMREYTGNARGTYGGCLPIREYGLHKRQHERFVLPYAVGCQPPTLNHKYF